MKPHDICMRSSTYFQALTFKAQAMKATHICVCAHTHAHTRAFIILKVLFIAKDIINSTTAACGDQDNTQSHL